MYPLGDYPVHAPPGAHPHAGPDPMRPWGVTSSLGYPAYLPQMPGAQRPMSPGFMQDGYPLHPHPSHPHPRPFDNGGGGHDPRGGYGGPVGAGYGGYRGDGGYRGEDYPGADGGRPGRQVSLVDKDVNYDPDYGLSSASKYAVNRFDPSDARYRSIFDRTFSRYNADADLMARADARVEEALAHQAAQRLAAASAAPPAVQSDRKVLDDDFNRTYESALQAFRSGREPSLPAQQQPGGALRPAPALTAAGPAGGPPPAPSSPLLPPPNISHGEAAHATGNPHAITASGSNSLLVSHNPHQGPLTASHADPAVAALVDRPGHAANSAPPPAHDPHPPPPPPPHVSSLPSPHDGMVSRGMASSTLMRGIPSGVDTVVAEHVATAGKFCRLIEESAKGTISDEWAEVRVEDGVTITKKRFQGFDVDCWRGVVFLPFASVDVFQFLRGVDKLTLWDPTVKEKEPIQMVSQDHMVFRVGFNSTGFFESDRDFVLFEACESRPDGTYIILQRTINHPLVPEKDGFVRGEIKFSGYVIKPARVSGYQACNVVSLVQLDPKGWLPGVVGNNLSESLVTKLKDLKAYLEKAPLQRRALAEQQMASTPGGSPSSTASRPTLGRSRSRFNNM